MSAPLFQAMVPPSIFIARNIAGSFRIDSNTGPCKYGSRSISLRVLLSKLTMRLEAVERLDSANTNTGA